MCVSAIPYNWGCRPTIVPMSDVTIEDTWYTAGMRASGSNCIVGNEVFVPEHRLMDLMAAVRGEYPTEFKDEASYRAAFVPLAALILVGPLGLGLIPHHGCLHLVPPTRAAGTADSTH